MFCIAQVATVGTTDHKIRADQLTQAIQKPEFGTLRKLIAAYKKTHKKTSDEEAIFELARDDFSERVRTPSYVTVNDRFIIKIDQYVRMINQKYKLEKEGLSTVQINDGELEIQDSDVEESDGNSEISDEDLEESDDDFDPEKKKLKARDAYMMK